MNFLQKPVGVRNDEKSVLSHFKKTTLFNEIQSYEVVKCNRGWWKIITMTIGGYEHHTDALYHFDYEKCDLVVANPTVSFLHSLDLHEDTQYNRDIDSSDERLVFLDNPSKESDIVNDLEKRYSITDLFIKEKHGDKIMIAQEDNSPSREWCECPCSEFCIAKVEKDGTIEVIILSPSQEMVEYCGFYQMEKF